MKFEPAIREELLALPRVGPRILAQLERAGLDSIPLLASKTLDEVLSALREKPYTRSTNAVVWLRTSQTRASLSHVLKYAKRHGPG